ncbi:MAG TPA: transporter [Tepidisphaeraceae bacterium]
MDRLFFYVGSIAAVLAVLEILPQRASAELPATAPAAQSGASQSSPISDKWQYTLFNPVPGDQLRDMQTDRPNIANTPHTIDAGHMQIETGIADYSYFQSSSAPFEAWGFGDFNFRVGVLNDLELSAEIEAYDEDIARFDHHTSRQGSFSDTILGGKLNLWGNEDSDAVWHTALAIQPHFKIPTADSDLGNGHFEFNTIFPFAVTLPYEMTFTFQPGFDYLRNANENGYAPSYEQAMCVDRVFFQKLDLYVEYAFMTSNDSHAKSEQLMDTGAIYQINNNLAVDTGLQFGLNRASPNFAATLGVSARF